MASEIDKVKVDSGVAAAHKVTLSALPDSEDLEGGLAGVYNCRVCCIDCGSHKGWLQHVGGKKHRARKAKDGPRPWRMEELELFPCRASTLCPHAFVADLDVSLRERLTAYLLGRCPHSPELVNIVEHISVAEPKHLRIKELVETVEAALVIGDEIYTQTQSNPDLVSSMFDMACGHGLLGCLLAYRFAHLQVVCVDTERRPCFDTYLKAFRSCGIADKHESLPLTNITFIEADLGSVELPKGAFLAGVHACNGATGVILDMAAKISAGYAVIPCCIPDALCAVQTSRSGSGTKSSMGDDTRYAVQVGVIAKTFAARRVCCIERRITNRNLVVLGGFSEAVKGD